MNSFGFISSEKQPELYIIQVCSVLLLPVSPSSAQHFSQPGLMAL